MNINKKHVFLKCKTCIYKKYRKIPSGNYTQTKCLYCIYNEAMLKTNNFKPIEENKVYA